ncbi:MAG: NAD(P)-dependent oxidoreductase, partial [Alphaproteobacteria bacterium]
MKVLLTWYANAGEQKLVRAGLPRGTKLWAPPPRPHLSRYEITLEDVAKEAGDADAVMGWIVPAGLLDAAPKVKALVWLHAGCDELDFAYLKRRGIKVANIRGGNAIAVAEHAMALMLGVAKRLAERHRWFLDARWQPLWNPDFIGTLLEGKTLAVIGLGQIGSAVARRARAFDMRVIGTRRHPKRGARFVDTLYGPADLHRVLGQADFVVLAVPITPETAHMMDAKAIAAMKPGAFLIN